MKLLWKIYLSVSVSILLGILCISYWESERHSSDIEQLTIREYSNIGRLVASEIEVGYEEDQWPFVMLNEVGREQEFLFWWIVNSEGIIEVADTPDFMVTDAYRYFPEITGRQREERIVVNEAGGYGVFIIPMTLAREHWEFHLGFSTEQITLVRDRVLVNIVSSSLVMLVLLCLVLYFVIRRFTKPISQLVEGAETIGAGTLDHRVHIDSKDEFRYLADAFNQMASNLKTTTTSIDNLNREILERQKAETALRTSEDRFKQVTDNAGEWIWETNAEGLYTYSSPVVGDLLGYASEEIKGKKSIFDFFLHDDKFALTKGTQERFESKSNFHRFLCPSQHKDGHVVFLERNAAPILDGEGKLVGYRGADTDVTERIEAEEKLREAQKQLVDASRQTGMSEVAIGVLHNAGNALNSVSVASDCLSQMCSETKAEQLRKVSLLLRNNVENLGTFLNEDTHGKNVIPYLEHLAEWMEQNRQDIMSEVDLLKQHVQNVEAVLKMQTKYVGSPGIVEELDVNDALDDVLRASEKQFQEEGIHVIRDYSGAVKARTDKRKLMQIFLQLVDNAQKALKGASEKTVQIGLCRTTDGLVQITMTDSGIGIPEENIGKLFSAGFSTFGAGLGYGLHIGALSAMDLGGTLAASSDGTGRGATFLLEFPEGSFE